MSTKIQFRRGTASQWTSSNPILSSGETGYETDTGKFKIGDGSTAWSSLNYFLDVSDLASTYTRPTYNILQDSQTAMGLTNGETVQVSPDGSKTFTSTVATAGSTARLIILTAGTVSRTITFGTGFKTTGTLTTGTVANRYFVFDFVSDGTNWIEMSRTVAIA